MNGGATEITISNIRNGSLSKSKYIIKIDSSGRYSESKLVTEGSDKVYVKHYGRDSKGSLEKVKQEIIDGDSRSINVIETGTYQNGKLSVITRQQRLSKSELQSAGKAVIEEAENGDKIATMFSPKGKPDAVITFKYTSDKRANGMIFSKRGKAQTAIIKRNKNGLIEEVTGDGNVLSATYEIDNKGNWTTATISKTITKMDGTKKSSKNQVIREIVYKK